MAWNVAPRPARQYSSEENSRCKAELKSFSDSPEDGFIVERSASLMSHREGLKELLLSLRNSADGHLLHHIRPIVHCPDGGG